MSNWQEWKILAFGVVLGAGIAMTIALAVLWALGRQYA